MKISDFKWPLRGMRRTPAGVARIVLAATLLFGVLASTFPLATIASGPRCELTCCAARAPHAAGSCMHGSCRAILNSEAKAVPAHLVTVSQEAEPLCGLHPLTTRAFPSFRFYSSTASYPDPERGRQNAKVSSSSVEKPCEPNCGSCVTGYTSPHRKRDSAALADANQPRLPSLAGLLNPEIDLIRQLNALSRKSAPRGPPLSFS
jgi:hypothetical protein